MHFSERDYRTTRLFIFTIKFYSSVRRVSQRHSDLHYLTESSSAARSTLTMSSENQDGPKPTSKRTPSYCVNGGNGILTRDNRSVGGREADSWRDDGLALGEIPGDQRAAGASGGYN